MQANAQSPALTAMRHNVQANKLHAQAKHTANVAHTAQANAMHVAAQVKHAAPAANAKLNVIA